jgi:hypothetical protein
VRRKRVMTVDHTIINELLWLAVGYDAGITFRLYEILKLLEGRK